MTVLLDLTFKFFDFEKFDLRGPPQDQTTETIARWLKNLNCSRNVSIGSPYYAEHRSKVWNPLHLAFSGQHRFTLPSAYSAASILLLHPEYYVITIAIYINCSLILVQLRHERLNLTILVSF